MDIRIGVTHAPREIDVELGDDTDREKLKPRSLRRSRTTTECSGSPTGGAATSACRRPRSPTSRSARPTTTARSASAAEGPAVAEVVVDLLDRRLLFVTGKGGVGKTTIAAALAAARGEHGKRTLVCEVDAKGNLGRLLRDRADRVQAPRGRSPTSAPCRWTPRSRCKEYLSLQLKLPLVGRIGPLARSLRLRRQRRAGREGDPHRRQALLGGARASTTTSSWSTPSPPATSSASSPRPQAINELVQVGIVREQTGWMLDILGDPARTGRGHRDDARGDAGQRDDRARRHAAHRDQRRPGRRRREPGAARAVRPRRGGGLRPAARARCRGGARRARSEPVRRSCSTPPSSRCTLRRTGAAHLADAARGARAAGALLLYVPDLFARSHGLRATRSGRRGARRGARVLMAPSRADARPARSSSCSRRRRSSIRCGSGGVGKTTTAAAAAAMAAVHHGGKVLVLTVDPARRLANALGPRGVRQRRDAGARRGVRGSRRRAARRAVGGDARHEAVVGRPRAPPRSRRGDPRRDPRQPALPEHHRHASCRATTTSRWSGCTRSTASGTLRPDRRRHAAHPQRASTSSRRRSAWPTSSAAGCCAGSPCPYRSRG